MFMYSTSLYPQSDSPIKHNSSAIHDSENNGLTKLSEQLKYKVHVRIRNMT